MSTRVLRLPGLTDYGVAHRLQQALVAERLAGGPDTIVLVEHSEVITVGRARGARDNVVRGGPVPVVDVERGGDVTWHGPGQLVAYPIVALPVERRDLVRHLRGLEEAVIGVLADLGVAGVRDERNTGVWTEIEGVNYKIASVGIAVRRWVTWHGVALNVDPDPAAWERVRPCGFDAGVMTRLADVLDAPPSVDALGPVLAGHLVGALGLAPAAPIRDLDASGGGR